MVLIDPFSVTMGVGFLAGAWAVTGQLEREGSDGRRGLLLLPYAVIGGLVGAKVYFAADHALRFGEPFLAGMLSTSGMTWYGGLIGGALLGSLGIATHGLPSGPVLRGSAIALPLGQMFGRIGCFIVGDDYGVATRVPWGVEFSWGVQPVLHPVHPTQLYETAWLACVALFLCWRRDRGSPLVAEYLLMSGAGRFAIEFLRTNRSFGLGLTQAQWIALVLLLLGLGIVAVAFRRRHMPETTESSRPSITGISRTSQDTMGAPESA